MLEASLMYESAHSSNFEKQRSMKLLQSAVFVKPVTLEHLKDKVENNVHVEPGNKQLEQIFASETLY